MSKLGQLEIDVRCACVICFRSDGSGFVMEDETDDFVLEFLSPQEALGEMQDYIDMEVGEQ